MACHTKRKALRVEKPKKKKKKDSIADCHFTYLLLPLPPMSSIVLNPSQACAPECRVHGNSIPKTPKWQHWSYSITLSPFICCLFVFSSPGSLMESDTTSSRKGMTFITPSCSCKWRGYLGIPPSELPGISGRFSAWCPWSLLVVSAAREPRSWAEGPRLRVSRTALSTLFLFQRVAGRFLKTCSLFMSLMLGSLPLLLSGLDVALSNIKPILPPLPPSKGERMGSIMVSACQGSSRWGWSEGFTLRKWWEGFYFSRV